MSQQLFADRLGRSKSWVEKVERGVRRLDRYSVITDIAGVLRVDVEQLLGNTTPPPGSPRDNGGRLGRDPLRAAMLRYAPLTRRHDPPNLPDLRKAVEHAWLAYQHAGYEQLTWTLPTLLRDSQAADDHYRTDHEARQAAHLLAQAYQITSSVLRKLGEHDLARLAADRAITTAVRAGDPLLAGVATTRAGNALLSLGHPHAALEAHLSTAHELAPGGTEPTTPERLSVFGSLLLQAAMAAAHLGDTATVRDLLHAAQETADTLSGDHNHYWTSFGPTNVSLHRVAAAVEQGHGKQALDTHQTIDPQALARLMPERRAHHLLDLSRAHTQTGNITAAAEALLHAERLAPAEIRHRPAAHATITDILRQTKGTPPAPILELARRTGGLTT